MLNKEEISKVVQENEDAKYTTQYSGSPVNSDAAGELVTDIYSGENSINERYKNTLGTENVFKSQINPGDFIGLLGGNFGGINNNALITSGDFWDQALYDITRGIPTLFNGSLQNNLDDPTKTSPHSGYPCVIGCGDNGVTPNEVTNYFDPVINKDTPLFDYYIKIEVEPSKAKFNTGAN